MKSSCRRLIVLCLAVLLPASGCRFLGASTANNAASATARKRTTSVRKVSADTIPNAAEVGL
jgi:hypothetical protein